MSPHRQVSTRQFFTTRRVFSLDDATRELAPRGGRRGTVERLKHYLETGRLRRVAREIYAVVPEDTTPDRSRLDPFLVAATIRPDAIFSHHSALELLGAGHSVWSRCTVFTAARRSALALGGGIAIEFLRHPKPLLDRDDVALGTRKVERLGRLLRATGPERTLVEGFLRPGLVGGVAELVSSASGFVTLDMTLLMRVLECYATRKAWAAVGWFLDVHRTRFDVSEQHLLALESRRPRSPQYLVGHQRGGPLLTRWNLILPPDLSRGADDAH